jgi:serine/threonine protein kinase
LHIFDISLIPIYRALLTTQPARDLLSKTLVPDPSARIKLSEMKTHPWMLHADSGPEPSKGDNSAATAGAPPVSGALFSFPPSLSSAVSCTFA